MPDLEDLKAEHYVLNRLADDARKKGDRPLAASLAAEAHGVCQEIQDLQEWTRTAKGRSCSDRMCGADDCQNCYR